MNRLLVGALVLALAGVGVGSAIGQGTGGTLGTSAVGTKTLEVRVKEKAIGINCGLPKPIPACFRKVRLGAVFAGSGPVYDGTAKVGTAAFSSIAAKKLPKGSSLDVFMATIVFTNRKDTLTVMGPSSDAGSTLPYSIVGGTGAYAGARGVVTEGKEDDSHKGEVRIPLILTFIP